MKVAIEVKDRNEGSALQAGLAIPVVKATAIIAGLLQPLRPGERKLVMGTLAAWNLTTTEPAAESERSEP